ncbi:MAG TPA: hypothetical protein VFY03_06845 [Woeseiaceae bacterium]|nr:hypothetical protein [Woeseiaceae bacterium]
MARISLLLAALALGACDASAECATPDDCVERSVDVVVHDDRVIRTDGLDSFFSFNLNHFRFERDLMTPAGDVDESVLEHLDRMPSVYYRYPGGLVANSFSWEAAVGAVGERPTQASVDHSGAAPVRFGVGEYFDFVADVGGRPWYVLNLLGWSAEQPDAELPLAEVTASNARLAEYVASRVDRDTPVYFQLGNELDRSVYQWPVEKYVERSQATMDAMRKALPEARFVAFLRDFDWTYKGKDPRAGSKSRYRDFIADVLDGLPGVEDFSLHFYYDDPGLDKRTKRMDWRLRQIEAAIDVARAARGGTVPNVWITEHARGVNLQRGKGMSRAALTSNLSASVSTADFLIGLAQIPEVKGAFWHGINAGPWQLFDATVKHRDLRPRPVYWGYRVLQSVLLDETLATETAPQPGAQYGGGYDVRAAAFRAADGDTLGLWVANRRNEPVRLVVHYTPYSGDAVTLTRYSMFGPAGADADDPALEPVIELDPQAVDARVDGDGRFAIVVGPSSVTAVSISR